jgi:hypothetical protein
MGVFVFIQDYKWFLIATAIVLYVVDRINVFQRLGAFKGPWSTSFSGWWHSKALLSQKSHLYYAEVNRKYGK